MKLFCFDMDGTLMTSKNTLSDKHKEAIKIIHDKGDRVILTTGRHKMDALEVAEEANIHLIVSSNGTSV
jgi:hydroxymethylpyrimidine pyrophosphatase-like HAD family hydrolase